MFLLTYSLSVGQKKATHQQIMAGIRGFSLQMLPTVLPTLVFSLCINNYII